MSSLAPSGSDAHHRLQLLLESHRRGHLRHRPGRPLHLHQPRRRADAGLAHRRGAGPQHACADAPLARRRQPLPGSRLPDLQRLPPRPAVPHRQRGAVARRRQRRSPPSTRATRSSRRGQVRGAVVTFVDITERSAPHELLRRPTTSSSGAWPSARASCATRWRSCASFRLLESRARGRAHAHRARDPRRARLPAGGAEDGRRTGSASALATQTRADAGQPSASAWAG